MQQQEDTQDSDQFGDMRKLCNDSKTEGNDRRYDPMQCCWKRGELGHPFAR